MPPGPSEPSSIPSARNATSTGTPTRPAKCAAAMPARSTAPVTRMSVPGSTALPLQAERVEDQPGDGHRDDARRDREHARPRPLVDRPLVDRMRPLLEAVRGAEQP